MLTIRQAQQRTGLSEVTIRRHITSGTIQSKQENGTYLIEESELAKLPKPRNRTPHTDVEKERFTQDDPFSLNWYREETRRIEALNKSKFLEIAEKVLV